MCKNSKFNVSVMNFSACCFQWLTAVVVFKSKLHKTKVQNPIRDFTDTIYLKNEHSMKKHTHEITHNLKRSYVFLLLHVSCKKLHWNTFIAFTAIFHKGLIIHKQTLQPNTTIQSKYSFHPLHLKKLLIIEWLTACSHSQNRSCHFEKIFT